MGKVIAALNLAKTLLEVFTMAVTLPVCVIRLCQIHKLQDDTEKRRVAREVD